MTHFSVVAVFIFFCLNVNTAILLNNVDIRTYQHPESLIRNLNATVQAMNDTIEGKVHKLQQSEFFPFCPAIIDGILVIHVYFIDHRRAGS